MNIPHHSLVTWWHENVCRAVTPKRADSMLSNKKGNKTNMSSMSSPENHHHHHDQQQHVKNHLSTISEESQDNKQDTISYVVSSSENTRIQRFHRIELTISRSWIDFCCWHDQTTRQWWQSCEAVVVGPSLCVDPWLFTCLVGCCLLACNERIVVQQPAVGVIRYGVRSSFHNARVKLAS